MMIKRLLTAHVVSSSSYHRTSTSLNSSQVKKDRMCRLHRPFQDFKAILEGKYDHIPEDAFRLVGGIEAVLEQAKGMGVQV